MYREKENNVQHAQVTTEKGMHEIFISTEVGAKCIILKCEIILSVVLMSEQSMDTINIAK